MITQEQYKEAQRNRKDSYNNVIELPYGKELKTVGVEIGNIFTKLQRRDDNSPSLKVCYYRFYTPRLITNGDMMTELSANTTEELQGKILMTARELNTNILNQIAEQIKYLQTVRDRLLIDQKDLDAQINDKEQMKLF